jgi:CBS domain-containing protein
MKVEQIMTHRVYGCSPLDTADVPARIMWEHDCGGVPVVRADEDASGEVVGMITDRDICMAAYTQARSPREIRVASAMSSEICTCHPNDPVALALKIMENTQLHRLPVVDERNQLVGIVTLADIAREAERERHVGRIQVSELQLADAIEAISKSRQPGGMLMSVA